MLIGYARVSKSDGSQVLDLQIDALKNAGVKEENIYFDKISGTKEQRDGLDNCLKALREDDVLVVYKLDRLGRSLKHLILTIEDLTKRKIGFKVLSGQGVNIDTTTPSGKMVFSIFAALAEFERELIVERTKAGLESARAMAELEGFDIEKVEKKDDENFITYSHILQNVLEIIRQLANIDKKLKLMRERINIATAGIKFDFKITELEEFIELHDAFIGEATPNDKELQNM